MHRRGGDDVILMAIKMILHVLHEQTKKFGETRLIGTMKKRHPLLERLAAAYRGLAADRPAAGTANLETTVALIKRLVRERWREYAPRYAVAFAFMALVAGTTALSAWIMKDVVNRIFVERDQAALTWVPLAIIAIFFVKGIATYLQEVTLARIGNSIVADAQKRIYAHLLDMDAAFFQRHTSNDLTTRITLGTNAARDMLNLLALSFGRDLLTLISLVGVMVAMNPVLTAIALLVGPLGAFGLRKMVQLVRKAATSEVHSYSNIIGIVRETSQGLRVVKSFQLEPVLQRKMFNAVEAVERLGNRIAHTQATVNPMIETLGGLSIAMVVAYAGWRTMSYSEAPGEMFAFITSLLLAADPARRLSKMQLNLAMSAVGVRMMFDLLDLPAQESTTTKRAPLVIGDGRITFDKVRFGYTPDVEVLKDVSFEAEPGKITALVGPSGGGKSTIFNLLLGFWTPCSGEIRIDGQSISAVSLHSLRSKIAFVSQDVFMFEGTVAENIAAGRNDLTLDDVKRAARLAHANTFIEAFPLGYDTPVGELGGQLSGGQRQRISIARAFLRDAPILLLDEPTSALDSVSEKAIQEALVELSRNRTTLVIAHRMSTIVNAHAIAVLDHGVLVEYGTHRELKSADGAYARLHNLQYVESQ